VISTNTHRSDQLSQLSERETGDSLLAGGQELGGKTISLRSSSDLQRKHRSRSGRWSDQRVGASLRLMKRCRQLAGGAEACQANKLKAWGSDNGETKIEAGLAQQQGPRPVNREKRRASSSSSNRARRRARPRIEFCNRRQKRHSESVKWVRRPRANLGQVCSMTAVFRP